MASASCSETPSNIRRLRAARLNFEAPSFSLGIDAEAFRSIPSCDEFPENRPGRGEEESDSLRSSLPDDEILEICPESGEGDNNIWKTADRVDVSDSEDDFEDSQISAQQRRFKRLKRGPSSAGREPQDGARYLHQGAEISAPRLSKNPSESSTQPRNGKCNLSRKTDASARRKSKDLSTFSTQLYKEPLPFVKDFNNQLPEGLKAAGIENINFRHEYVQTGSGDRVVSSKSDYRSGQTRLETEVSLGSGEIGKNSRDFCSTDVSKFEFQREGASNEGTRIFNDEALSASQLCRINPVVSIQPTSRKDVDVDEDDIEEFSDDGLFGSGSRTQKPRRRSLRPQTSGSSPILLSSSPETSAKPVLHIPRADFPPKLSLRVSHPFLSQCTEPTTSGMPNSEDDPFLIDDFVSESGWRRTNPDLSKPGQTPQHLKNSGMPSSVEDALFVDDIVSGAGWRRTKPDLSRPAKTPQQLKNSTSDCQRADSVTKQFKTSTRDLFRDTSLKSFYTETPARRDIVGPSQSLRNVEANKSEEARIQAFLRQRFPHFKPVDSLLVDGGLDNEPVYIDYRRQFAEGTGSTQLQSGDTSVGVGRTWPTVRSIKETLSACPSSTPAQRRNRGKSKVKPKNQPSNSNSGKASSSGGRTSRPGKRGSAGSVEGKWRTVNGSRVYVVGNQRLSGQRAYSAYKKRSGNSSTKKQKKWHSTKSK